VRVFGGGSVSSGWKSVSAMALEYLLFAAWCFAVAAAGGLVGLVLGNLRLPATLLIAGTAAAGTGANLIISAVAAATAAIVHVRGGRINWGLFAVMAPPSILGALVGGYLSGSVPRTALLLGIAAVLLYSAFDLSRWTPPARTGPSRPGATPAAGVASNTAITAANDAHPRPRPALAPDLDLRAAVASGALIGLLGGFVGLILGSLRMPALLRVVGEIPARAAGTNVTVGVCVGIAGAIGHLPSEPPDWTVAAIGAAASIPGALLGARLTGRLSEVQLVRGIALALLVAGIATLVEAVV
jgi:uncharacterized membrane protein YfcA